MDQAEQLRNIIKLNKQQPKNIARILTVTSGKGGVGKSNIAVNLAVQFQNMGKKVIIFDADFGLANVEVMFGAIPKYNLSDLIYNGMNIRDIITQGPENVGFISGGSGIVGLNNMSKAQISFLIRNMAELDNLADIIIIDTGAGISDSVMEFVMAGNEILLVVTPDPSSLTDSYSLLKAMNSNPRYDKSLTVVKVIANKAATREEGEQIYDKLYTVVEKFLDINMEFLGIIPTDPNIERAVIQQKPVSIYVPQTKSVKSFEKIAVSIIDNTKYEHSSEKLGMSEMFSRFLNRYKF